MSLRWIPNAICIFRLVLIWPIVLALLDSRYSAALVLSVVAGGSDALDGFLAKRFDWRTRIGGLLDPVADKLLVTSMFVTLTHIGLVPLALTVIVVARDVVILSGASVYGYLTGGLRGEPTVISKANTFFQLLFLVLTVINAEYGWIDTFVLLLLGAAVVFTSITSGLGYVLTWTSRTFSERRGAS